MPQPLSIPWLEANTITGAIELQDQLDSVLTLIDLFTPQQFVGDRVSLPQIIHSPKRVAHTTAGGGAMPISPDEIQLHEYTPSWIKLEEGITPEDKRKFYDAQAPVLAGDERLVTARVATADQIIDRLAARLRTHLRMERKALCAGALNGEYSYKVGDGPTRTVNLGLTGLTNPTTHWDNAAATILEDIPGWQAEFRANNATSAEATHVFYNPKLIRGYLLNNTQLLAAIGGSIILNEWLIGIRNGAAPNWLDELGRIRDPLFGLTWVPIEGTQTALDGSSEDVWPATKLAFARLPDAGPKWFMTYDAEMTPDANFKIEVGAPMEGQAVKNHNVVLFFNGLPGFERPDLVMTVDVDPA